MSNTVELADAVRPSNPDAVPALIESLNANAKDFKPDDKAQRHQLLADTRKLLHSLQTPRETMLEQIWANVCPPPQALFILTQVL